MSWQWKTLMRPWGPGVGVRAMHVIHMYTGKFYVLDWAQGAWVWDPDTGRLHDHSAWLPSGSKLSCAGHCQLADGRILWAGGNWTNGLAPTHVFIYDPGQDDPSNRWSWVGNMAFPRFYPTCTTLWDGRVLISGGWQYDPAPRGEVKELEIYDPADNSLTTLQGPELDQEFYPFMFLLPDQKILSAGPRIKSHRLTPGTPWTWDSGDPAASPPDTGRRDGSAVIFDAVAGKVLKCGGGVGTARQATGLFTYNDIPTPPASWWRTSPDVPDMAAPRKYHNLVILPDQTIVAIGGIERSNWREPEPDPVLDAEVFDPADGTYGSWASVGGPMPDVRWYHSSAALLRNGRVFSGSGNLSQAFGYLEHSALVLKPGYLSGSPDQPEFDPEGMPPGEIDYEQTFQFKYTHQRQGASIAKAALIRLAAVTHSFDMDQRYVPLVIDSEQNKQLSVLAPDNGWIAPPGYYMLWIVDDAGVPCTEAHYVKVKPAP